MSWKHYIAGIATTLAVGGFVYWISQTDKITNEELIWSATIKKEQAAVTEFRLVKQDRKWNPNDAYRLVGISKDGVGRIDIRMTTMPTLETSVDLDANDVRN